ncbi:unnamed protein product [Thelazia callipaeda]|uniref:SEFIR domain-containing protein n=1 Tax=Thelazia callipaeda TaxID=103827 RepID=A0A0N5CQ75_THECL|nr:unnamed protein product [Thelazia callipaeda]
MLEHLVLSKICLRFIDSTSLVSAFMLEIENSFSNRSCFYFDISNLQWNSHLVTSMIFIMRRSSNTIASELLFNFYFPSANLQASRWTGGFRRILVHSVARTIQVEFMGAPVHYCFEGYEIRLKDESGLELLHSAIIPVELMRKEYLDNQTVLFGEYNFTDLEVDQYFIPSVIPVERSRDGRCLCPVASANPFDSQVVCSCIAADWNKVRIQSKWIILLAIMLVGASVVIFCLFYFAYLYNVRHQLTRKAIRIRFVIDRPTSPTTLTSCQSPLIHIATRNVLLVYSHDSTLHEKCVLIFAEYLRNVFGFNVHLDVWDVSEIERNLVNYLSSSILSADKLIVINSHGAYYHYRCKLGKQYRIERNQPDILDSLFDKQIDQVLVHSSVISARFKYSHSSCILPPLSCSLQYVIPEHTTALISNLTDSDVSNDPPIQSYGPIYAKLIAAITEMTEYLERNPNWFSSTHRRVLRQTVVDGGQDIIQNESIKPVNRNEAGQSFISDNFMTTFSTKSVFTLKLSKESGLSIPRSDQSGISSLLTESSDVLLEPGGYTVLHDSPEEAVSCVSGKKPDSISDFPVSISCEVPEKQMGGNLTHDSGFISERDFLNT